MRPLFYRNRPPVWMLVAVLAWWTLKWSAFFATFAFIGWLIAQGF